MNTKIAALVFISVIVLISAYFIAGKFDFLPKGKMEYSKESIEKMNDDIKSEQLQENIPTDKEEIVEEKPQENIKKGDTLRNEVTTPLPEQKNDKSQVEEEKKKSSSQSGKIIDRLMSSGFKTSSGRKIDTIIVHTSYNAIGSDPYDIADIIKQYEQYEVSAHYLIGRDGAIYRLVKDKDIAWHAGVSKMPDGRTNINDFSIGIEVVNTKEGKFSKEEYEALNSLIKDLKEKYDIKYVLGHNDIAPGRKTDPWGIEWEKVNK